MIPPMATGRGGVSRLLAWIVGVPFFVLPVPLTVDAPDVYGGYAIHAQEAAILAGVGLVLGLGDLYGLRFLRSLQQRPRLLARLKLLGVLPLLLLAAATVAASGFLASQWAAVLGLVELSVDRPWAPPSPIPLGVPAFAALALRAAWDPRREAPALRVLGVLGGALVGLMGTQVLMVAGGPGLPLAPGAILGAALFWPRLMAWRGSDRWFAAGVLLAGAALGGATAVRVVGPWAHWGGFGVLVPAALGGTALGLVLGEGVRRWAGLEPGAGPARIARGAGTVALGLPLLAALWAFGSVLTTVGFLVAHLLVELWGLLPAESLARWQEPRSQPPLALAWAVLILRLGWQARSAAGVVRFGTGLALAWSALVLGRVVLLAAGWAFALWLGGFVALFIVLVAFGFATLRPEDAAHRRWMRFGVGVALALLLPVALRYAGALTVGAQGAFVPTVLGLCLAVAVAWWLPLERLARPQPGRSVARSLVVRLPLFAIALVTPTYIVVYQGIDPAGFAVLLSALLLLGAAGLLLRRRGLPGPSPVVVLWCLFYAGFALTMRFKEGPSAQDCAAVIDAGEARVLVDRHREGGEYLSVHPYDVLGDPTTGGVLATFKRWDKRGGFVELIDRDRPDQRARTRVLREGEGGPLWPERLEQDPATGRVLMQVIGVGQHGLWELGTSPAGVAILRKMGLRYEPANPWLDPARRRLVLSYVPNRAGGNPLAEVYDLDTLQPLAATTTGGRKMQMADFVTGDPSTERIYVPALFDFARFAIVEIDARTMSHTRHLELFHPAIGVAVDAASRRLFVTNPIAGRLDVYSLDSWSRTQSLPTGPFPRDVAYDAQRRTLWVADYGDGAVIGFRTDGAKVVETKRSHVGSLLRGVGLDPATGSVFAASGCGVFEVSP